MKKYTQLSRDYIVWQTGNKNIELENQKTGGLTWAESEDGRTFWINSNDKSLTDSIRNKFQAMVEKFTGMRYYMAINPKSEGKDFKYDQARSARELDSWQKFWNTYELTDAFTADFGVPATGVGHGLFETTDGRLYHLSVYGTGGWDDYREAMKYAFKKMTSETAHLIEWTWERF